MTRLNIEDRTVGQTVWSFARNGNCSTVTITKVGKLSVTCSDGNTYNLRPQHDSGALRGEKFGARITVTDSTSSIEHQKIKAEKNGLYHALHYEPLTVENLIDIDKKYF